jgi:4'-phosphopantetheinyl transferase
MIHNLQEKNNHFQFLLSEHEIHVFYAGIPNSRSVIQSYYTLLSSEEKKRSQKFRFEKDINGYIFKQGVLRKILGNYIKIPPNEIIITLNEFGKPKISNAPSNHHIDFNISSSNSLVALAFAFSRNLGIDLEYLNLELNIYDILPLLFTHQEAQRFEIVENTDHLSHVLQLWTLKEAYVKAIGVGLHKPLKDISFVLNSNSKPYLEWELHNNDILKWNIKLLEFLENDYVGALIYDGPDAQIIYNNWLPD